ncbi:fumarate hydratase, partial [Nocardioides mangrovi]
MPESEFRYTELLPTGSDDTAYRLVTTDGVATFEAGGRTFLRVAPEAIRRLTEEAMLLCQDTGTAIVMGKKSEGVLTGIEDGEAISRGVYDAYTKLNLRYS